MKTDFRIYIDTAPLIYYLSKNDLYFSHIEKFFAEHASASFYTSLLTEMEYIILPLRNRQFDAIKLFEFYVDRLGINICPVDRTTTYIAATIRSIYPFFKSIDALHLATASILNCDLFFTNDKQLAQFSEINCLLVDDFIKSGNTQ